MTGDTINLYEQQQRNRRATILVMAALAGLLALAGAAFDLYLGRGESYVPVGTLLALCVGGGSAWTSFRFGDQHVLKSTGAIPVDQWTGEQRQALENVVEEMAIASGLPKPRVFVIPDEDPNAFATGRDPQHASIAVTEGLLKHMNREELQGVIAHEMSHIRNYDIRVMTIVAAMAGAIVLLSDWAMRSMAWGGRGKSRRSGSREGGGAVVLVILAVWLVTVILAPIISRLLTMLVSRKREYLADASAAELTRNPLGLARALEKLESFHSATKAVKRGVAHLCIVDPLERKLDNQEGWWAETFSTHPPLHKRVAALKEMAYVAKVL